MKTIAFVLLAFAACAANDRISQPISASPMDSAVVPLVRAPRALKAMSPGAQAVVSHRRQQCSVWAQGWRQFASVKDPEPFSITWGNHMWPQTGEHDVAVLAVSFFHNPATGSQCLPEVGPDLVFNAVTVPWPGEGHILYTPGNGVWYFSVKPLPFMVGMRFYCQLYTQNHGVSETMEFTINS